VTGLAGGSASRVVVVGIAGAALAGESAMRPSRAGETEHRRCGCTGKAAIEAVLTYIGGGIEEESPCAGAQIAAIDSHERAGYTIHTGIGIAAAAARRVASRAQHKSIFIETDLAWTLVY
jgi:hypothetical protein